MEEKDPLFGKWRLGGSGKYFSLGAYPLFPQKTPYRSPKRWIESAHKPCSKKPDINLNSFSAPSHGNFFLLFLQIHLAVGPGQQGLNFNGLVRIKADRT